MSRLSTALHNDAQLLALLRDELALQAHLLKAELKERWDALEAQRADLAAHIARAEAAGSDAAEDAETAVRLLLDSLRAGYENIRAALK